MATMTETVTSPSQVREYIETFRPTLTLDGERAVIGGYRNAFASVMSRHSSVEFAWATVGRIITTHGNFKS